MQILTNKAKLTAAIALVLLMVSATLMAMRVQPVQAALQDNGSVPLPSGVTADETYTAIAHMSFRPNPIGVGQPLLVNLWLQPPLHAVRYFKDAYLVTFTKPDGTTDTVGPVSSYQGDATAWFEYTVDKVGTWKIKFDFLGAYFPAGDYNTTGSFMYGSIVSFPKSVYYKPDSDGPYEFVVQNELALSWPPSPLPTDYWTRPVSPENREWWPILGNYPATGVVGGGPNWPADTNTYMSNYWFIPYVQGPKSAHIVWKRQDTLSGLIGGVLGQTSFSGGGSSPSMVYLGRAYQTITKIMNGTSTSVWQCYDLRTGEVYWERYPATQVPTMITYVERTTETVPGEEASKSGLAVNLMYVGGGRLIKYDPWLGTVSLNISIAPLTTGTFYADPYFLSVQTLGNTTNPIYRLINWTVVGDIAFMGLANLRLGVLNNVTWPFSSLGTVDYEAGIAVVTTGISTLGTGGIGPGFVVSYGTGIMAASLKTGQLLWNITTDLTTGEGGLFSGSTSVADHGKFAVRLNDGHWHCWDLYSGKELWLSELTSWPWGTFGCYGVQSYGGVIISNQYDGVIAYNWTNGKKAWWYTYKAQYPYETPYQDYMPWFTGTARIADGILYTYNTEHSPSNPIMRGQKLHAINVTTGEGIWNITGSMAPGAVSDGYLTGGNTYDGYMYVFGKGKSATTVSVGPKTITQGASVVIEGTVLDQSPAQLGTPCVSKDSMATYMEYLHMQKPIPSGYTVTGVPVKLLAFDSDGNVIDIGTTTSDVSGTFGYAWTPPKEGLYRIAATFAGDDSYGSSWAETHVSVGPAPASPTPTPTPQPQAAPDNTPLLYATVAIIIAVAIVGILILLALRKRQ